MVGVDTPFGFVPNMAIENIVATQGDNAFITDFSITLKQIRTAKTQLVDFDSKTFQGRTADQKAEEADKGKVDGKSVNQSLIKSGINQGRAFFSNLFSN